MSIPVHKTVDQLFTDNASIIMNDIRRLLESEPVIRDVVRSNWPDPADIKIGISSNNKLQYTTVPSRLRSEHTCAITQSCVQSPDICLHDLKFQWQIQAQIKNVVRVLFENLRCVWQHKFRNDLLDMIPNRRVLRSITDVRFYLIPEGRILTDSFPRRINFFGKVVNPYKGDQPKGVWAVNPKYLRAATQYIVYHSDIARFTFPDVNNWAGELTWKNITNADNLDGSVGYFRVLMTVATNPLRPELGEVITVPPPGFVGTLWYWTWKLLRVKP